MPYLGPPPASKLASAADIASGAVDSDEIAAGAVDIAHLSASGTAGSGNYLRGDNSWAAVSGGLASGDVIPADDGSVGAPGLSFADDTDNGIYRIGANNFGVAVAGALAMEFDPIGAVQMPLQPSMHAAMGNNANITGDGTDWAAIGATEYYDQNSDHDNTTGVFTAPVTGKYLCTVTFYLNDVDGSVGHTEYNIQVIASNRAYAKWQRCVEIARVGGDQRLQVENTRVIDMDAADTVYFAITIDDGTKIVDVGATQSGSYSIAMLH